MEESNPELDFLREVALMAKVKARHEVNNHRIWTCFVDYEAGHSVEKAAEVAARIQEMDRQLHKDFKRYWRSKAPRKTRRHPARPMTRVADFVDLCWSMGLTFRVSLEAFLKEFLEDFISLEEFQGAVRHLCYCQFPDGPILGKYFMNQYVAQ